MPVLDEWLISGSVATFPAESAEHPELVFRNPRLLERGWEQQRQDRGACIEFFGTDLVVLTGAECESRMKEFRRNQNDAAAMVAERETSI